MNAQDMEELDNAGMLTDADYVDYTNERFHKLYDDYKALKAENVKLREVVEAIMHCAGEIKRDKGCDACPMFNADSPLGGIWCRLYPTLRELGIEVGE